jgi:diguanylate cyclase (GGDEF)-like protein
MRLASASIRTKMTLFVSAFLGMLLIVIAVAVFGLIGVDRATHALNRKWLAETRLLGEMSDQISELRLFELCFAAAKSDTLRSMAAVEMKEHRISAETIAKKVAASRGSTGAHRNIAGFTNAANAYFLAHDRWLASVSAPIVQPVEPIGDLGALYERAENAIDTLAAETKDAADRQTRDAERLTQRLINVMAGVAIVSICGGIYVIARTRKRIFKPLQDVTEALAQLTAGNSDVSIRDVRSDSEIGKLIRAFNAFRSNVLELEQARDAARVAQQRAETLAYEDALTGLANRRVVVARLEALAKSVREGRTNCALMIIDLDRFKPVNDLMGHAVGDFVLCEVARRLASAVAPNDIAARLGGDEFALIVETNAEQSVEDILRYAERIHEAIAPPIRWGDAEIEIGASIGVSSSLTIEADAGSLFRAADIAMYRAKKDDKLSVCLFHPAMAVEVRENARLEEALRKAIVNTAIKPFYQPLVDLTDEHIVGFEILARWTDPQFGEVPPDVFIPIAERIGLVPLLTSDLARQACADAAAWPDRVRLSLNISAVQLKEPCFVDDLLADLAQTGFPPSRLEIEITETALISDIDSASRALEAIRAHRVKVALDDFGTGFSSLTHLREFKLDKVKIDKTFVQTMLYNTESRRIVLAMLNLVKSLGLATVGEGVEHEAAACLLRSAGCDYGQGYFFGEPMDAADATALLVAEQMRANAVAAE